MALGAPEFLRVEIVTVSYHTVDFTPMDSC